MPCPGTFDCRLRMETTHGPHIFVPENVPAGTSLDRDTGLLADEPGDCRDTTRFRPGTLGLLPRTAVSSIGLQRAGSYEPATSLELQRQGIPVAALDRF